MSDHILKVKNLKVELNRQLIINNISFSIEAGQIVAIIGPNGSGKSTLFKALLALLPYNGQVLFWNKPVQQNLSRIAYVPQHFDFDRSLPITVAEFLGFNSLKHKISIDGALQLVGMQRWKSKNIGLLSGGQMQRVLIAAALLREPEILFLDEPLSGIDIEGTQEFYQLILKLNHERKVTILMISHELNAVYKFADDIICLNRDLICKGNPQEVITQNVLQNLYGNHVEYKLHHHHH